MMINKLSKMELKIIDKFLAVLVGVFNNLPLNYVVKLLLKHY
ncbi:hypothetical protein J2T56_000999 [Natronobacillus azotifigens]